MNHATLPIIALGFLTIISCGQAKETETTATEPIEVVKIQESGSYDRTKQHFEISFKIEKIDAEHYNLIAAIDLDSSCFVVSPYSPDNILLPVSLTIPLNKLLTTDSTLIEFPITTEEYDSITEEQVRYARVNTTCTQKLILNSQDDFEVSGQVDLMIEPICIPYRIDFIISNTNGELTVAKTKTTPTI